MDLPGPGPARPLRRFGQNFLADERIARWLVDRFDPQPGQRVVEIGPGRGALTRHLAPRCGSFVALEIDRRLIADIERVLSGARGARILEADALTLDWGQLAAEAGGPLRVIGNLPFNVGTAILRRLLATDAVADIQVVLQLEVAKRLLAAPGGKDYGPLSVIAALRARGERLRDLAPGAFRPRPKVTARAIRLEVLRQAPLPAAEVDQVEAWLFRGFSQRRKQLVNLLAGDREWVRCFLVSRGLRPDSRAEAIPPDDWLALARALEERRRV